VFDQFAATFRLDTADTGTELWDDPRLTAADGYSEFARRFAGRSFNLGLYRVHDTESGPRSADLLREAFPAFASRACPFGYDWLGRQFAVDADRREEGQPLVLLLEPGTGQALEIPLPFRAFHDQLGELREAALAAPFFAEWSEKNQTSVPLKRDVCVGYRVPLFLGGTDAVQNLEVVDFGVYWSLAADLLVSTRDQPPGTRITGVSIDE
jgi:T6SS immunity protein Tdi1, C-terminal